MSFDAQRLYELLPAVYRIRDAQVAAGMSADAAALGGPATYDVDDAPLGALVAVLAEQALVLEENLAQLYDDQFIETCAAWVVPYIGDLVGARNLHTAAVKGLTARAQVADTIRYRRRKGTAAVLEQLARAVTGWDAHVVEFFQHLEVTQYMKHLRPDATTTLDLRKWEPLERLGTPFDSAAHTLEVRSIASGRGRFNIPNVGIFLWRLGAYSLTGSPATAEDTTRFRFDPLGRDLPLYSKPVTEPEEEIVELSRPENVPLPLSRRVLDAYLAEHYGADRSVLLLRGDEPVPLAEVVVCNLTDTSGGAWGRPPAGKIAIDPALGRIVLPDPPAANAPLRVTYHYGFAADLGGGEYDRADSLDETLVPVIRVPTPETPTASAIDTIGDGLALLGGHGALEIDSSGRYEEPLAFAVRANDRLEVRAGDQRRPTLVPTGGVVELGGGDEGELTLNGLLIAGRLHVEGALTRLNLRHCTLVPTAGAPSLVVASPNVEVEIERCILGAIHAVAESSVTISDSIVDATAERDIAYAAPDGTGAGAQLRIERSTVIGRVHADSIELASNSIFLAERDGATPWVEPVRVERRQEGCVRFCYVPLGSQAPRRYRCLPVEPATAAGIMGPTRPVKGSHAEELKILKRLIRPGTSGPPIRPEFTSLTYGDAGYCRLSDRCPVEIREGADDESELGVFHDLYQHQRETNLRVRLDEYLRFGLEAGIFHAS